MARHHPEAPAAETDMDAAVRAACDELQRRKLYEHLLYLEKRIASFPPVPGDPPYVETSRNFAKS